MLFLFFLEKHLCLVGEEDETSLCCVYGTVLPRPGGAAPIPGAAPVCLVQRMYAWCSAVIPSGT